MKPAIFVLLGLAVLIVAIVVAIGSGALTDSGNAGKKTGADDAEKFLSSWVAAMQQFLAPFFSLDDDRLSPQSLGQAPKRNYRLTDDELHEIAILPKSGADIETGVVRVEQEYAGMIVRFKKESGSDDGGQPETAETRGPRSRIKPNAPPQDVKTLKPGLFQVGTIRPDSSVQVTVRYLADEEEDTGDLVSEPADRLRLAVLEAGGTLRLQCRGCSQSRPVTVVLE